LGWVSHSTGPLLNAAGEIIGVIATLRDITERKKSEDTLRRSAVNLADAQRIAHLGSWEWQILENKLSWSDETYRIFGLSTQEFAGTREAFLQAVHPDDRAAADKNIRESLARRVSINFEHRLVRPDGSERVVHEMGEVISDKTGRPIRIVGTANDITEHKAAERLLREQHDILSNSHEGVMIENLAGEVSMCSRGAEEILGWTRTELIGRRLEDLLGADFLSIFSEMRAAVERLGSWSGELRLQTRDGRKIIVDCRTTLVQDEKGRPRARLSFLADITEKKLLEEKFIHAQRLEGIGMLAAGLAHDLNNMLTPIMFAATLLRDSLSSAHDLKLLDTLERSAGRGAQLVRQILGFAHTTTSEFHSTQVKHILRDMISVIEETFPKSIQLQHQIPSDLWPVQGNATQIHQVLLNLCVNARDAMPQGGTLRITATNLRLDAAAAGAIPGAGPGAWLVLEVADTGTGILPGVLERIWTPFFTTKGAGKGTGLGLATVRGIVVSHHGFVELQTKVGRGSAFRVFFPANPDESSQPIGTSPLHSPNGHGELILVVDDDVTLRDIVSETLENHGYRVVSCGDGMEAIALFEAHPEKFSLVITDVDMPRLGGVALAHALLRLRPNLRLVAMSGLSRDETDTSDPLAMQKLAHAFLRKPFTSEDLLGVMDRLLHPPGKP
jgi:PAS domain S-box-containing protein